MFLDYDGTLSPIVANPDAAYMSDAVSNSPLPPATLHFSMDGLPRPEKNRSTYLLNDVVSPVRR
jgi:hypothetical protein